MRTEDQNEAQRGVATHRHSWQPDNFHEKCSRCGWRRAWVQVAGLGLVQRYFRVSPHEFGAVGAMPSCTEVR